MGDDITVDARTKAARLPIWESEVEPEPLGGGITNVNFVVSDAGRKYVVRVGDDIPVHQVMRFNELAASRAAEKAGISPAVRYHAPGVLVIDFIEGKTLGEEDVRNPDTLSRILPVVKECHRRMAQFVRGPALMFWVFHVLRDYAWSLEEGASRHLHILPELRQAAGILESAVGPIDVVYAHNDLLPANFIDDGERIWLIDWDYAGFNSPLFDLGGLASNAGLEEVQEEWLLGAYYESPVSEELRRRYRAMKCASLLRETMWSMISEIHSELDFDFSAYTIENLARFNAAFGDFKNS